MPAGSSARGRTASGRWPLGLALVAAALACSPVQRHAALNFVFDGVPPYRTPAERAIDALEAAQRDAEVAASRSRRRSKRVTKLARFTHGPFAANECTRCHDLTTSSGFRGLLGGGGGGSRSSVELAEAGRLRMPVNELCVHCHSDFDVAEPANDKLWLHGPVASGWCVLCHEPHSGRYAALVVLEPTARLCSRCHLPEDLVATAEHRPLPGADAYPTPPTRSGPEADTAEGTAEARPALVRDCTRCHDPHMGRDRLLLRPRHQWEEPPSSHTERARADTPSEGNP